MTSCGSGNASELSEVSLGDRAVVVGRLGTAIVFLGSFRSCLHVNDEATSLLVVDASSTLHVFPAAAVAPLEPPPLVLLASALVLMSSFKAS